MYNCPRRDVGDQPKLSRSTKKLRISPRKRIDDSLVSQVEESGPWYSWKLFNSVGLTDDEMARQKRQYQKEKEKKELDGWSEENIRRTATKRKAAESKMSKKELEDNRRTDYGPRKVSGLDYGVTMPKRDISSVQDVRKFQADRLKEYKIRYMELQNKKNRNKREEREYDGLKTIILNMS